MSDVFDDLLGLPGAGTVSQANLAQFLAAPGAAVIVFTGDSLRRTESTDVAVVLRELLRNRTDEVRLGIVDRRDEGALMQKLGVVVFPALVLVRDGEIVEIVARMRDWPVYAQAFDRLLTGGTAARPPIASPSTRSGGLS